MGITSSSNSPRDQFLSKEVGYTSKQHLKKSFIEEINKELDVLFAPKREESFVDRDTEADARYSEFMKGGPCKESFTAMEKCVKESGVPSGKCNEPLIMFLECVSSHPDYYHPFLAVVKSAIEHGHKEVQALNAMKQALKDDALAARNQSFRDKEFRRF
ncbi:hypothetical protein AALP_AA3G147700 [Arabis alpina]|uniref:GCK domain-containing protein n=1 Tax=Arabis alpina TaxID=50452 RepID=A0A087H989_ARAAL|nr:hypothetical protein AALP_AA3G147700 [Arabis alpina]